MEGEKPQNLGNESWKKPIPDYANEKYVDIDKRIKEVDAKLVAGHSEEQRDRAFDAYHEVVRLEPSQEVAGLSVSELKAITDDLQKKMKTIEKARENVKAAKSLKLETSVIENLEKEIREMKLMIIEETSVTEKTFLIEEGDNEDTRRAKNKLKTVFEHIQMI